MIITEKELALRGTNANLREKFASLVLPAGTAYRFAEDRPQVIRTQILKKLTGQDLTGLTEVTVNLDVAFPKPGNSGWQGNDFSAVAFIFGDGGSASSADKETISTFNYWPTNSVVVDVPVAKRGTGKTIEVYHVGGNGILDVSKQERVRGKLPREVFLFGPVDAVSHNQRDPFLLYSLLRFKPYTLNQLEQIQINYTSNGASDVINATLVSGVQMPLYIRLEFDEILG